eukprot:GHVQ01035797.1.p1 GENE.GHVQ01035797.1~~GHVQ01035797.1.p1  ORF type:complete len:335 (-),score=82.57 GHVQ01035797.1:3649-4653(-)
MSVIAASPAASPCMGPTLAPMSIASNGPSRHTSTQAPPCTPVPNYCDPHTILPTVNQLNPTPTNATPAARPSTTRQCMPAVTPVATTSAGSPMLQLPSVSPEEAQAVGGVMGPTPCHGYQGQAVAGQYDVTMSQQLQQLQQQQQLQSSQQQPQSASPAYSTVPPMGLVTSNASPPHYPTSFPMPPPAGLLTAQPAGMAGMSSGELSAYNQQQMQQQLQMQQQQMQQQQMQQQLMQQQQMQQQPGGMQSGSVLNLGGPGGVELVYPGASGIMHPMGGGVHGMANGKPMMYFNPQQSGYKDGGVDPRQGYPLVYPYVPMQTERKSKKDVKRKVGCC